MQSIKNLTKEDQIKMVSTNGFKLDEIENPDEEVQLAAVRQNGLSILCLLRMIPENEISEKVKTTAIQENPRVIVHLNNPTKEQQRLALMRQPMLKQYILNIDPEVEHEVLLVNINSWSCEKKF